MTPANAVRMLLTELRALIQQVSRYVTERTTTLLDKHVGQARAGLQTQLGETHRRLGRDLDRWFGDGAARLADRVGAITREWNAASGATLT